MRAAALLVCGALLGCGSAPRDLPPPHGIVLIVLDTLRADGLAAYGNPRPTSPAIDQLAREGVLFENAISHASWTLPGFVGLLSGRYPSKQVFQGRLRSSLVEQIRNAGYATAAFTEGAYVSRQFGMDRGFDSWWEQEGKIALRGESLRPAEGGGVGLTFTRARDWLRENGGRPFFLMIHTYETHGPYGRMRFAEDMPSGRLPERIFAPRHASRVRAGEIPVADEEVAYVRALYDASVAEADRHVGELLQTLESLDLAERTVVVLTSDHGQLLGERRRDHLGLHGENLYDPSLHVPLILRDPRRETAGARVTAQVRLIDVLPTVLDLAGAGAGPGEQGSSLAPLMSGASSADRLAYSELLFLRSRRLRRASVRTPEWKLILNAPGTDAPTLELYDLAADPLEHANLVEKRPEDRERLYSLLAEERSARAKEGRAAMSGEGLDPALRQRLRSLGYAE